MDSSGRWLCLSIYLGCIVGVSGPQPGYGDTRIARLHVPSVPDVFLPFNRVPRPADESVLVAEQAGKENESCRAYLPTIGRTVEVPCGRQPSDKGAPSPPRKTERLVPESVPFISDRDRAIIRSDYLPAHEHKALAISLTHFGIASGQSDDEAAKAAALNSCQKATETAGAIAAGQRCDIYAIGDFVVYARGHPALPPKPWVVGDAQIERPFSANDVPFLNDKMRGAVTKWYAGSGMQNKALAVSPRGSVAYYRNQASPEEAERRALEACGSSGGVPCMIVAVNDSFVVPITASMKITGFFQTRDNLALAPDAREVVARRIEKERGGWSAVAAGAAGRAGVSTKATSEQAAINAAMADCSKQDRSCRIIAVDPFSVELRGPSP